MPFHIQASTLSAAIGAGGELPPFGAASFHDYTHRFTLSKTGSDDVASGLATFGGNTQEAKDLALWGRNAHGFDQLAFEPFDSRSAADRMQEEADREAAEIAEANTAAKRIVRDAKAEAARIVKAAQDQARDQARAAKGAKKGVTARRSETPPA